MQHPSVFAFLSQIVHVRQPGSLEMRQRSVRQLSGESLLLSGIVLLGGGW